MTCAEPWVRLTRRASRAIFVAMKRSRLLASMCFVILAPIAQSCSGTPADRCVQYEQRVQAFLDRCGVLREFHVVDPTTRMPVCGRVRRVGAGWQGITRVCYPYLDSADCSTVDPADPLATLPPECDAMAFEFSS